MVVSAKALRCALVFGALLLPLRAHASDPTPSSPYSIPLKIQFLNGITQQLLASWNPHSNSSVPTLPPVPDLSVEYLPSVADGIRYVVFTIDNHTHTENFAPWISNGDVGDNHFIFKPSPGKHSLRIAAYYSNGTKPVIRRLFQTSFTITAPLASVPTKIPTPRATSTAVSTKTIAPTPTRVATPIPTKFATPRPTANPNPTTSPVTESGVPSVYYVRPDGSDSNSGRGPAASEAWQSIRQVNATKLTPGSAVYFLAGKTFVGKINIGSGDAGDTRRPVTFGSYEINSSNGSAIVVPGNKSVLSAAGNGRGTIAQHADKAVIDAGSGFGIWIQDTSGVTIQNLEIKGSGGSAFGPSQSAGIVLTNHGGKSRMLSTFRFNALDVHDFGSFGLLVEGAGQTSGEANGASDIEISGSNFYNNVDSGVLFVATSAVGGGTVYRDAFENVTISDCDGAYNFGHGATGYGGGNGYSLGSISGLYVEGSNAYENGATGNGGVGFMAYMSDNVTFESNSAHDNHTAGSIDGDGFDFDWGASNSIMKNNRSWNNDGIGYLLCSAKGVGVTGVTITNNSSSNDGRRNTEGGIEVWGLAGSITNATISGNSIHDDPSPNNASPVGIMVAAHSAVSGITFRANTVVTTGGVPQYNFNTQQPPAGVSIQ